MIIVVLDEASLSIRVLISARATARWRPRNPGLPAPRLSCPGG
jgi:hypothetical protein